MKELQNNKPDTELSVKQKKQIQHDLIGTLVPHEGHIVWKINKETLEVEPAKFSIISWSATGEPKKQLVVQDGYAYVAALNKKNALKKYHKGENGGKELGNETLKMY